MDYPLKNNLNLNNCGINMLHDIKYKHSKKKKKRKKNGKCQQKKDFCLQIIPQEMYLFGRCWLWK